jgi:leucyl aminopeptidase
MKTNTIQNLEKFTGTIIIPVYETYSKSLVPIEFHGVSVSSKIFYGKKDSFYVVEKYDVCACFCWFRKTIDYKSLKTALEELLQN